MRGQGRTVQQKSGCFGAGAHGLVTRRLLLRAGLTARQIDERLRAGALIREYPGVYRVGHAAPSLEAHYRAAVLACVDGALLSGRAAGFPPRCA